MIDMYIAASKLYDYTQCPHRIFVGLRVQHFLRLTRVERYKYEVVPCHSKRGRLIQSVHISRPSYVSFSEGY